MQRLTDLFRGDALQRARRHRGVFALLLVPMLGFAALAVDVGRSTPSGARLQVAADAAAIAVAQDCSRGNCGDMLATAPRHGRRQRRRRLRGAAGAQQRPAERHRHRPPPVQHWFAPVIGHDSTAVSADARPSAGARPAKAPPSCR